ncbi:MAG: type II toxin-antitoxin system PemK/MazF family toxin [Mariniphaga sp.]|jgi:mRNA interferase MazF|nr:type II toxin-antitoxin system PemK/MazF family toxin [Mariniphaga sp.]
MERFVKGEVVVVPFPFSDLSESKRRPALVLADLAGDDIILCQITSKTVKDFNSVILKSEDFTSGNLNKTSNIRPNRIFTADKHIVIRRIGRIHFFKINEVINKIVEILNL